MFDSKATYCRKKRFFLLYNTKMLYCNLYSLKDHQLYNAIKKSFSDVYSVMHIFFYIHITENMMIILYFQ